VQADQTTGDPVLETELDQVEALDSVPEFDVVALEQVDQSAGLTRGTRPRHKRQNRGGRPSKLTIETALKLGLALGRRNSVEYAANQAGVGRSSVYRWIAQGRSGDPRFATLVAMITKKRSDGGWKGWDLSSLSGSF
jgi:hypothetical protein